MLPMPHHTWSWCWAWGDEHQGKDCLFLGQLRKYPCALPPSNSWGGTQMAKEAIFVTEPEIQPKGHSPPTQCLAWRELPLPVLLLLKGHVRDE